MTFRMKAFAFVVATAASAMSAGTAQASLIQYPDRVAYDAAVPSTIQNFDGFADGTLLVGPVAGGTYTTTGGTVIVTDDFLVTTSPNGIGGTTVGYFLGSDTVTFTFGIPIRAFG